MANIINVQYMWGTWLVQTLTSPCSITEEHLSSASRVRNSLSALASVAQFVERHPVHQTGSIPISSHNQAVISTPGLINVSLSH